MKQLSEYTRNELKELLTENVYDISFEMSDGTIRFMKCTTNPNYLPPKPPVDENAEPPKPKKPRKENLETIPVYELGVGWRSFKINMLITMDIAKEIPVVVEK